jgi:hypothetical protein
MALTERGVINPEFSRRNPGTNPKTCATTHNDVHKRIARPKTATHTSTRRKIRQFLYCLRGGATIADSHAVYPTAGTEVAGRRRKRQGSLVHDSKEQRRHMGKHEGRGSEQRGAGNGWQSGARTGAEPLQLVISRSPTSVILVVTRAAAAEAACGGKRRIALLTVAAAFATSTAACVERAWRATAAPATTRVLRVAGLPPVTNRGLGVVPAAAAVIASPQPGPADQGRQKRGRGARRGARRRGAARALARTRAIARAWQVEALICVISTRTAAAAAARAS